MTLFSLPKDMFSVTQVPLKSYFLNLRKYFKNKMGCTGCKNGKVPTIHHLRDSALLVAAPHAIQHTHHTLVTHGCLNHSRVNSRVSSGKDCNTCWTTKLVEKGGKSIKIDTIFEENGGAQNCGLLILIDSSYSFVCLNSS